MSDNYQEHGEVEGEGCALLLALLTAVVIFFVEIKP